MNETAPKPNDRKSKPEGSKSTLEVVLMPLVVALVGVVGTAIISIYQVKSTSMLADAEREAADILTHTEIRATEKLAEAEMAAANIKAHMDQEIKILDIFSHNITSGEPEKQEYGLKLLRALAPDLHEKLASAVVEFGPADSMIEKLALEEQARANQRIFNEEEDLRERESSQGPEKPVASHICDRFAGFTKKEWYDKFLINEPTTGTWHVFVASLPKGYGLESAQTAAQDFDRRFEEHKFLPMETVSSSGERNYRYAVVIARGIVEEETAREIARYADKCVARGAYPYRQVL